MKLDPVEEEMEPVDPGSDVLPDEMGIEEPEQEPEPEPEPGPSRGSERGESVKRKEELMKSPDSRLESKKKKARWKKLLLSGSDTSDEESMQNIQSVVEVEVLKGSTG